MKKLGSILFILMAAHLCAAQNKEFIEYILDDFECRSCNFVVLEVIAGDFVGNVTVENDDLYSYLEKTEGFGKVQYKTYVTSLIQSNQSLVLKNASLDDSGYFIKIKGSTDREFQVVLKYDDIDEIASKGCETFVRYYFLGEELESIRNPSGKSCTEFVNSRKGPVGYERGLLGTFRKNSVIDKLFKWQIPVRIEHHTNRLILLKR